MFIRSCKNAKRTFYEKEFHFIISMLQHGSVPNDTIISSNFRLTVVIVD